MTTDFIVQDHGSLVILIPQNTAAKDWADEHFPEDAQNWASGTVIERGYFPPIYDSIISDGFTVS